MPSVSSLDEVAGALAAAHAEGRRVRIGDDLTADGLVQVLEHDPGDLTCTVEAGVRLSELRDVLAAVPARARDTAADGLTPLFWLPSDDAQAVQAVDLLLANGADPRRRSPAGRSAEDIARERGLDAAAARLAAAAGEPS